MFDPNALHIYTDGSSYSSPRRGGIGIRFVFPDYMNKVELDFCPEGYIGATNNQMELKACSEALEEVHKLNGLQRVSRIIIYTDSSYVVDNYPRAIYNWSRNQWRKRTDAPVENTDLWKELIKEVRKVHKRIEIEKVKGHSKNKHNKAVDKLAKISAKNATRKLPGFVNVRRKRSDKSVELGSVKMLGQRISIRIIIAKYLEAPHKIWKYKYEVVSKDSRFYKKVDEIYSHEPLRQRFTYLVSLNKNNDYPKISRVLNKTLPSSDE
jgi:ribonuclease HI